MTGQEFFSFCCANFSMVKNKKVPNLIKIKEVATIISAEQVCMLWKHYGGPFTAETKNSCFQWNGRMNNSPFTPLLLPKPQSRNHTRRRVKVLTGWFCHMSLNASSSKGECKITLPSGAPDWEDICCRQTCFFVSCWVQAPGAWQHGSLLRTQVLRM